MANPHLTIDLIGSVAHRALSQAEIMARLALIALHQPAPDIALIRSAVEAVAYAAQEGANDIDVYASGEVA